MAELDEPITEPPDEEEGDDSVAGGGQSTNPPGEDEIEDAPELDEDEEGEDESDS